MFPAMKMPGSGRCGGTRTRGVQQMIARIFRCQRPCGPAYYADEIAFYKEARAKQEAKAG